MDYQFNIFNALAGVRPGRRWDASLYLGPSLALGDKGSELAWNFGGILSYAVSRNLSLFYSHTIYRMSKDRYESPQVYRTPGTIVNSLNVGMMYNLNRPAFGKDGVLVTDYAHQPLFFEYSIGPSWYDKVQNSLGSSLGYTANANVGWWLNSAIGLRGGVHISNADWAHDATAPRKNQLGFFAGTLDLMFNPLGMRHIYDWNQAAGFNLFVGGGLGKIRFVTSKNSAYESPFNEVRLGAQLWLKLTNDLRLNLEPTYSMMGGFRGNKVVDNANELAMKIGVSMLLRDKSKDNKDGLRDTSLMSGYSPYGFFMGGGLGWNTAVHTWRPTGQGFSLLKNGLLFAGYKVNDYHGIRLSGEYLTDKVWQDYGSSPLVEQKFNNTLLSLDYQFNIFNALAGVRPGRRWDASLYLGPSLALGDKGSELAWNFGGILSYAVSRNLSLFYSHTIYRMSKDRYKSAQVYRTPGTIVNSLNVGLMYQFSNSAGRGRGQGQATGLGVDYRIQPLFFEYSVGPSWYDNVDLSMGSTLGYTANANLGWWLNSAIGLRGGLHIGNGDWLYNAAETRKNHLGFLAGTMDLMLNPMGITRKYDWNQSAGFNLFVGGGLGKIRFVKDRTTAYETKFQELRLGGQFWVKLSNNFRLTLEPTYSMMGGFEDGKVVDKVNELGLKFGVSMFLGDRANQKPVQKDEKGKEQKTASTSFFFGGGLGWNTAAHTWHYTGQSSSLLKNGLAFAGYKVNDYHGVRLSGEYLTDKVWIDNGGGNFESQDFKNTLVSLDYQLDLLNVFAGVAPNRRWDASLYLGPSVVLGEQGTEFAWNVGGMFSYNVSRNTSLFYSHTIYRMSKDRYNTVQVYRTPGTMVNSLNIGVMFKF